MLVTDETVPIHVKAYPPVSRNLEDNVLTRIFHSPLIWATATTSILCAETIMVIIGTLVLNPVTMAAMVITAVAVGIIIYKNTSKVWKDGSLLALRLEISITRKLHQCLPSCFKEQHWYDRIVLPWDLSKKLYLSALPMATMGHDREIVALDEGHGVAVLSATMRSENTEEGLMGDPVRPSDWQQLGVAHHQEEIIDLHECSSKKLQSGSDFINSSLLQRKATWVHCKAGRERSGKMMLTYLMRYEQKGLQSCKKVSEEFIDTAIRIVKESRPRARDTQRNRREVLEAIEPSLA